MNLSIEKLRLPLWVTFGAVLYYSYIQWQTDYPPPIPPAPVAAEIAPANSLPPLPAGSNPVATKPTPATPVATTATIVTGETIHITTDVLDLDINTLGGDFTRADLIHYPQHKDRPNEPMRLFDTAPETFFVARTGLRGEQDDSAPTHLALYTVDAKQFTMPAGSNDLVVPLKWTNAQGVEVVKTYTFRRGQYAIHVEYQVNNHSSEPWKAASYVQLQRHQLPVDTSIFRGDTYAHTGPATYDGKSYKTLNLKKDEDQRYKTTAAGGWIAAMQHHFVAAAIPDASQTYDYQLQASNKDSFTFTYTGPLKTVEANAATEFNETLYVGPKLHAQLEAVGSKLERTVDYGMFTIIAEPMFMLLSFVQKYIGNWGWSIIIVTFLIKAAFYKLTESSGRSMARTREAMPRLKALQERYKDDREQLGRATMEFYKREKLNPASGCLPMLLQMPFWMAFYWVLANNVEMRQAPFLGWITDLSSRDPYFILPVVLGIANFAQFKLNPAPADPVQAKVMAIMPIGFTVMMAWFPSGLTLYWVTNTSLSILQQWHINRVVAASPKK